MPSRSRDASHAGSWYTDDPQKLSRELDDWLDQVPRQTKCIGPRSVDGSEVDLPSAGARVIIAPHAGYAYSGRAAAWAYRALDMTNVKRVFILGPSHHHYLTRCALSQCTTYETPLGDLTIDLDTVAELQKTGMFDYMSQSVDEAEHSIEMHLPYVYKMLSRKFQEATLPPIVPILVGATNPSTERSYGKLLAPYLADPTTLFVVSSDFCHWGSRFRYTYYEPSAASPASAVSLRSNDRTPRERPIHASIADVDMRCVAAVESGDFEEWCAILEETGNTVCGRHPIGIIMCALEALESENMDSTASVRPPGEWKGRFRFVRYERSSDVVSPRDSSVSYCSGFAVL